MSHVRDTTAFRAALVQMRSGRDVGRNVRDASALIREAARQGAHYVQTPEVTTLMDEDRARLFAAATAEENSAALSEFRSLAASLGLWLHIGSMAVLAAPGRLANRSYLLSPAGAVAARYDKIHLFDVDLPTGEAYRESNSYTAGDKAVVAELPWGGLGLTVCYDLRFPHLFRALAHGGARFIAIPAAFTRTTGEAHWHTLVRARAIETQCFVLAASQGGLHDHGRETYGHSLIVSPWGKVLAEAGKDPCVVIADIDPAETDAVRARVPSLAHDRPFAIPRASVPSEAKD